MNAKLKVFIMAVIGFVVTTISTLEVFNIAQVILVTVAFAGTYAVKNYFMPSDSPEGKVFWKDILSGLIIAVCMGLSTLASTLIPGVEFSWSVLWTTISGAVIGYFTKTVAQGQRSEVVKKVVMIAVLFSLGCLTSMAQSPFTGFFDTKKAAVKSIVQRGGENALKTQVLVRLTANMTATAYDFYETPVQIKACESAGIGLSIGKYEQKGDGVYCKLSGNALLLTSVKLADKASANVGFAVTGGLFNNILQFGVGYLDQKFMPLIGVGLTF